MEAALLLGSSWTSVSQDGEEAGSTNNSWHLLNIDIVRGDLACILSLNCHTNPVNNRAPGRLDM